jgi:hypothetical protein
MGLSLSAYFCLSLSGGWLLWRRVQHQPRPTWLRPLHIALGTTLVTLVVALLSIGLIGTLGRIWQPGALCPFAHWPWQWWDW